MLLCSVEWGPSYWSCTGNTHLKPARTSLSWAEEDTTTPPSFIASLKISWCRAAILQELVSCDGVYCGLLSFVKERDYMCDRFSGCRLIHGALHDRKYSNVWFLDLEMCLKFNLVDKLEYNVHLQRTWTQWVHSRLLSPSSSSFFSSTAHHHHQVCQYNHGFRFP